MFSKVDFNQYAETRKTFYDKLSDFVINSSQMSESIQIDSSFMERINNHFDKVLARRLETIKFSKTENKEYKDLIKKWLPETKPVFEHKGPTIYWFKINYLKGLTNEAILNHYSAVKNKGTGWWTKVDLARKNVTTEILYLGKIETAFENRFVQHIGLGHNFTTALKLQRWMPSLENMTLTFQFLKLDKSLKAYTEDIEKVLWEECKPLLGESPRF